MQQLPSISNFHSPNGVDQKQMADMPDQSEGLLELPTNPLADSTIS